jgi:hypothetical protein
MILLRLFSFPGKFLLFLFSVFLGKRREHIYDFSSSVGPAILTYRMGYNFMSAFWARYQLRDSKMLVHSSLPLP